MDPSPSKPLPNDHYYEILCNLTLEDKGIFFTQILDKPKLFISCLRSAKDEGLLKSHGITQVFSFARHQDEELKNEPKRKAKSENQQTPDSILIYKKLGITRYLHILQDDETNSDQQMKNAFEDFEELCRSHPDENILIHCVLGASRSVSFVATLIAKSEKWTFLQAVQEIRKYREVGIDAGFAKQLCRVTKVPFDKT